MKIETKHQNPPSVNRMCTVYCFCEGPSCFLKYHYQYIRQLMLFHRDKAMSSKSFKGHLFFIAASVLFEYPILEKVYPKLTWVKASLTARLPKESGVPESY